MFTHRQNQLWQLTGLSPCTMGILVATWNTKLDVCWLPINDHSVECAFSLPNLNNQVMHKSQHILWPWSHKCHMKIMPIQDFLVHTGFLFNLTDISDIIITDNKKSLIIGTVNILLLLFFFLIFLFLKSYITTQVFYYLSLFFPLWMLYIIEFSIQLQYFKD